ncbi:M13 family peptidase [Lactobacillus sp. DCY120]|uniref:M13 family peptidase n=1 Tax=Bombilactobacillus apium TaxID=2675299 RepID=A0A850R036_9LACO|nr:M13-type metalloendopeptidase [Bombilactobacillus apium]NVY96409.1 M13 family peptidase [Bombilactobacillus apium]
MQKAQVAGGVGDNAQAQVKSYQDNLYLAVNGKWLETAEIPADRSSIGSFRTLDLGVEKQLMADFAAFASGDKEIPNALLAQAVALYRIASDISRRDQAGFTPAQKQYDVIKQTNTWEQYLTQLPQWLASAYPLPFGVNVEADMKDTQHHKLYLSAPSLILPDTTYYAADNEQGPQLLALYRKLGIQLLQKAGETATQATQLLDLALQFDQSLVKYVKSAEEHADYVKEYNPQTMTDFAAQGGEIDFATLLDGLVQTSVEEVIVTEPRYYAAFKQLVNKQTYPQVQAWTLVQYVFSVSSYLSQELRQIAGQYSLALSGVQELRSPIKQAYSITNQMFSEPIGQYYGQTYFGAQAKADVERMIHKMIAVYEQRIENNTWLGTATKQEAIKKLQHIILKIGYPEEVEAVYHQLKVDPQADLLTNIQQLQQVLLDDRWASYQKPVDRKRWDMPGHLVNACYDSLCNDVTFPAAILQAPFYSLEQSSSENYGGIGAVIAHEISHGFDNNGSHFDEYGNLNDWWTPEDYATFEKLTQAMVDEFDGLSVHGGQVNGKLTVSENVADAGGLSCALEAVKSEADVDLRAFFINWARVWQVKMQPKYGQMLLKIDVHAPDCFRANVQAQNMDDFYPTFKVTENDGMWLAPEKRVNIW